jgi:hypothetical protein
VVASEGVRGAVLRVVPGTDAVLVTMVPHAIRASEA